MFSETLSLSIYLANWSESANSPLRKNIVSTELKLLVQLQFSREHFQKKKLKDRERCQDLGLLIHGDFSSYL